MRFTVISSFGFEDFDPAPALRAWAARTDVCAVQGYRNPLNPPTAAQMLAAAAPAGLPFDSLHGLHAEPLDLSSPDESVRALTVETHRREGELARRLGANAVVVHPSGTVKGYDGRDRPTRLRQAVRSINELSEIGQSLGVDYLVENQPHEHPVGTDIADLLALLDGAAQARIGVCFDVGHAHLFGDAAAALRSVGPRLRMIHASDNDGLSDAHRLCLDGTVDWRAVGAALKAVGFAGPFVFEVFWTTEMVESQVSAAWFARLRDALGLCPRELCI